MYSLKILRQSFEKFYSSEIKLIVSIIDRDIVKKLDLPGAFQVYEHKLITKNEGIIGPLRVKSDGDAIKINTPPQFCIALLSFSMDSQNELKILQKFLWSTNFFEIPELICYDKDDVNLLDLNNIFINYLITKWKDTAERSSNLEKELALIRKAYEENQNTFARYEDFLSYARIPPVQLRFTSKPNDAVAVTGGNDDNTISFIQRLPISIRGLAIIEIHLKVKDRMAVGNLIASVRTLEDPQELAIWQIPYEELQSGWRRLVLPNIWSGPKQTGELELFWKTISGESPAMSMTIQQPIEQACLRRSDGFIFEQSLALRLWTGLPEIQLVPNNLDNFIYNLSNEIQFDNMENAEYVLREGWGAPESGGVWSIEKHARMTLMLDNPVEEDLCLIANLKGFIALESGYKTLCDVYVNNQKLESWHFGEDKITENKITINADLLKIAPIVDIWFEILDPKSPFELGRSQDKRKLGVYIKSIRLEPASSVAPQPVYQLGDKIKFGLHGNATTYLDRGWGQPEEFGAWTIDNRAYLSLKVSPEVKGPLSLITKAKGYVVPKSGYTCICHVYVNNQEIDIWHFKKDKTIKQTAIIDAACLEKDSNLNIMYEFPVLKSPKEMGQGLDERKLGMYVQSIQLRSI